MSTVNGNRHIILVLIGQGGQERRPGASLGRLDDISVKSNTDVFYSF